MKKLIILVSLFISVNMLAVVPVKKHTVVQVKKQIEVSDLVYFETICTKFSGNFESHCSITEEDSISYKNKLEVPSYYSTDDVLSLIYYAEYNMKDVEIIQKWELKDNKSTKKYKFKNKVIIVVYYYITKNLTFEMIK